MISVCVVFSQTQRTPKTVDDASSALCGVHMFSPAFAVICCTYPWRDGQAELT